MSAHGGRERRRRGHEEEHENHERWAVSYGDMMTVLCALFIVLYSMSQVDQVKYEALAQSLAEGFNNKSASVLDGSAGVLKDAAAQPVGPTSPTIVPAGQGAGAGDLALAHQEVARLQDVKAQVEERLAAAGMGNQVRYVIDERGLVLGMVANDVYFDAGSAALKPAARTVLDAVAPVLAALPDQVSVEGHADSVPVSGRYPTNWELSSDRATQVLRHLVETGGVAGGRISAVGYGDARPMDTSGSPEALASNRRVDLVVRSSMPETVRGLIPAVVAGTAPLPAAPPPVEVAPAAITDDHATSPDDHATESDDAHGTDHAPTSDDDHGADHASTDTGSTSSEH